MAGPEERDLIEEHAEKNVAAIIEACRARGVPLLLCTVPANLQCPAFARREFCPGPSPELDLRFRQLRAEAVRALDRRDFERARVLAEDGLARFPEDHPRMSDFHHLAALAFAGLGEPAEAKAHYLLAKDLDWFPLRATAQYNDMIRRQARERGLVLLDAERITRRPPWTASRAGTCSSTRVTFARKDTSLSRSLSARSSARSTSPELQVLRVTESADSFVRSRRATRPRQARPEAAQDRRAVSAPEFSLRSLTRPGRTGRLSLIDDSLEILPLTSPRARP